MRNVLLAIVTVFLIQACCSLCSEHRAELAAVEIAKRKAIDFDFDPSTCRWILIDPEQNWIEYLADVPLDDRSFIGEVKRDLIGKEYYVIGITHPEPSNRYVIVYVGKDPMSLLGAILYL